MHLRQNYQTLYASAFLELAEYVDKAQAQRFVFYADRLLVSLSSEHYRSVKTCDQSGFLLAHAVDWYKGGIDLDKPLIYADYYYLEALIRKLRRLEKDGSR